MGNGTLENMTAALGIMCLQRSRDGKRGYFQILHAKSMAYDVISKVSCANSFNYYF